MGRGLDVEALLDDSLKKNRSRRSRSNSSGSSRRGRRRRRSSSSDGKPRRRDNRRDDGRRGRKRSSSSDGHKYGKNWTNMVDRSEMVPLTEGERDARTVLLMQLPMGVSNRDIEIFFEDVGKLRDIRFINDRVSRRSKGIAYIEFQHIESVTLAIKKNGGKIKGYPILIQNTMSEKNRTAIDFTIKPRATGPAKLHVGNLNPNITEKMLRAIFEPFGYLDNVSLQTDEIGNSKGYATITFRDGDNAKQAIDKMDGFELVGKRIRVCQVTERNDHDDAVFNTSILDDEETDKGGVGLNATSRSLLMQKLAASRGVSDMLGNIPSARTIVAPREAENSTCCVIIGNMFDYAKEGGKPEVMKEIENDVNKVVSKYAQICHLHVDSRSREGNVYIKLKTVTDAEAVVEDMSGRKYAGRVIKAYHIPTHAYHKIFPNLIR